MLAPLAVATAILVAGSAFVSFAFGFFASLTTWLTSGLLGRVGAEVIAQFLSLLGKLLSTAISAYVFAGMTRFSLDVVRKKQPSFDTVFRVDPPFVSLWAATLLFDGAAIGGSYLLLLPGLLLASGLLFYMPIMVDKNKGAIESLKASWQLSTGQWSSRLMFTLICGLLVAAGVLFCCVGVFVTAPLTSLAMAYAYCLSTGEIGAATPPPPPPEKPPEGGGDDTKPEPSPPSNTFLDTFR